MLEEKDKTEAEEITDEEVDNFFPLNDQLDNEFGKLCSKIDHSFKKLRAAFSTENIEWSTSTYKYFHYTKLYIDKIIEPLICKNAIRLEDVDSFRIIKSLLDVDYNTLEKMPSKSLDEIESAAFSGEFEELEDLIIHNLKHERSDFLWFFKEKYTSFVKIIKGIFYENGLIEKLAKILYKYSCISIGRVRSKMRKLVGKFESIHSLLFQEKWIEPFRKKVYFLYVHEKRCEFDTDSNLWECAERYRSEDFFQTDNDLNYYYNPMLFCFFRGKILDNFLEKTERIILGLKRFFN